jgi:hypothetical protein
MSKTYHFYKWQYFIYIHDKNLKRRKYINTHLNQKTKHKYKNVPAMSKRVKKPLRCASQF